MKRNCSLGDSMNLPLKSNKDKVSIGDEGSEEDAPEGIELVPNVFAKGTDCMGGLSRGEADANALAEHQRNSEYSTTPIDSHDLLEEEVRFAT